MRCEEIINKLEELSPVSFAMEWDNIGLLVGRKEKEVHSIYIAMDATDEVIEEAVRLKADMLLTHHPLIFEPLRKINSEHFISRRVIKLIQNDINYYVMHTNFDVMGMADAAADELSLKGRQVLEVTFEDEIAKEGIGRYGRLPHLMTLEECAEYVKAKFGIEKVKVFGELDAVVETAAISPGSGKSVINPALKAGVDVLITGDIDHHAGIDAQVQGLMIIDAGHYATEKIFVPYMKEYLEREAGEITVYTQSPRNPFWIL